MIPDDRPEELEAWLHQLFARLQPAQVKRLTRRLAVTLRQRQGMRIAAQMNPDGTAYVPRRRSQRLQSAAGAQRTERERVKAMFSKLRTASHLKAVSDSNGAVVAIEGRSARIARVHQFGLVDRAEPAGPSVKYASRVLLGWSGADREWLHDVLIQHLTG